MRISDWSSDVCSSDLFAMGGVFTTSRSIVGSVFSAFTCFGPGGCWEGGTGGAAGGAMSMKMAGSGADVLTCGPSHQAATISGIAWTPSTIASAFVQRPISPGRSEEHTSELQSLMRISYAVFCLKKKTTTRDKEPAQ